jgi:hypothetical protein
MKEPPSQPTQLNPLAAGIAGLVACASAPAGLEPALVDVDLAAVINSCGINLDYRPRLYPQDCAPTHLGAAFDPEYVRTQTVALLNTQAEPVAVMTLVIEPRFWLQRQRYLIRDGEDFRIAALAEVLQQNETPAFAVGPGWTYVLPQYRNQLGRFGLTLMTQLVAAAADAAPTQTWFMAGAAGPLPFEEREILAEIWERPIGSAVRAAELPVETALVGSPRCESRTTATFAQLLGWKQLDGVADQNTLGPVFAKRIK